MLPALGHLGSASPDPFRSEALIARATRTLARRHRFAEKELRSGIYSRIIEPAPAAALSVGFLAAVFGHAIAIVQQAHVVFLWR